MCRVNVIQYVCFDLCVGGRGASAVRALPQAGVRNVRHSVLRARQAQRALPGRPGPPAEET